MLRCGSILLVLVATALATAPAVAAPRRARPAKAAEAPPAPPPPEDELELELDLPPPAPAEPEPAPPPAAAPAPVPVPVPVPETAPEAAAPAFVERLRLTAHVAAGLTNEEGTGAETPTFAFGGTAEYFFTPAMGLALGVSDRSYRRTYLATTPDLDGGPAFVDVFEQGLASELLFSYEVLHHLKIERFSLAPQVGPSFRWYWNDSMPSMALGAAVGARAGFAVSETLDVWVSGGWAYNFLENESLASAAGGPLAVSTVSGGLGLRLAPRTRLRLGYDGEIVTQAASYRFFHAFTAAFDVSL